MRRQPSSRSASNETRERNETFEDLSLNDSFIGANTSELARSSDLVGLIPIK